MGEAKAGGQVRDEHRQESVKALARVSRGSDRRRMRAIPCTCRPHAPRWTAAHDPHGLPTRPGPPLRVPRPHSRPARAALVTRYRHWTTKCRSRVRAINGRLSHAWSRRWLRC